MITNSIAFFVIFTVSFWGLSAHILSRDKREYHYLGLDSQLVQDVRLGERQFFRSQVPVLPPYNNPFIYPSPYRSVPIGSQDTRPITFFWSFKTSDDCHLSVRFLHYERGDPRCNLQYLQLADDEGEIRICGSVGFSGIFVPIGNRLFIQHYRRSGTLPAVFGGYVTCVPMHVHRGQGYPSPPHHDKQTGNQNFGFLNGDTNSQTQSPNYEQNQISTQEPVAGKNSENNKGDSTIENHKADAKEFMMETEILAEEKFPEHYINMLETESPAVDNATYGVIEIATGTESTSSAVVYADSTLTTQTYLSHQGATYGSGRVTADNNSTESPNSPLHLGTTSNALPNDEMNYTNYGISTRTEDYVTRNDSSNTPSYTIDSGTTTIDAAEQQYKATDSPNYTNAGNIQHFPEMNPSIFRNFVDDGTSSVTSSESVATDSTKKYADLRNYTLGYDSTASNNQVTDFTTVDHDYFTTSSGITKDKDYSTPKDDNFTDPPSYMSNFINDTNIYDSTTHRSGPGRSSVTGDYNSAGISSVAPVSVVNTERPVYTETENDMDNLNTNGRDFSDNSEYFEKVYPSVPIVYEETRPVNYS